MKKIRLKFIFLLILSPIFLTFHCKSKVSDPVVQKPNPPILVPKTSEIAGEEKGIDAIPEKDAIFVEWFSTKNQTAEKWRLFREVSGEDFRLVAELAASDTFYVDKDIFLGKRYFYFLTAVDARGRESAPSDTVSYKLLPKAVHLGNTLTPHPEFEWGFTEIPPVLYVLRLFRNPDGELIWLSKITPRYGSVERTQFNWDKTAEVDSLERGVSYFWRVDEIGAEENAGSESNWKIFTLP